MATTDADQRSTDSIRSLIPARIDRLVWSRFHTRMIVALGVAWILDGLEITIASAIGPLLGNNNTLHMSSGAIGDIATWYLVGEVPARCSSATCPTSWAAEISSRSRWASISSAAG